MRETYGERLKEKVLKNPILYKRLTIKQKKDIDSQLTSEEREVLMDFLDNCKEEKSKMGFFGIMGNVGAVALGILILGGIGVLIYMYVYVKYG